MGLSGPAAGLAEHRDGARRWRRDVRRAHRAPVPARVRARGRRGHGRFGRGGHRRRAAGVLDRLVRRQADGVSRRHDRRPRGQRHGQRPGDGGCAADGDVHRVHPRGGHSARRDRPRRAGPRHGGDGGRRQARDRRHQGGRLRSRRRRVHQHGGHRPGRRARRHPSAASRPRRCGHRQRRHRRARRRGDELPGGAGVRDHDRQRHRAAARAGRGDARHRRRHPRASRPDPRRRRGDAERDRQDRESRYLT